MVDEPFLVIRTTSNHDLAHHSAADSWPVSFDGSNAGRDWGWAPAYGLEELVSDMLSSIRGKRTNEGLPDS